MHLLAVIATFGTLNWAPIKTREVRITRADVAEVANLLRNLTSERGQIIVNARRQTVRIADFPWEVDLMMRVVRAIERTLEDDQKVWITSGCMVAASDLARRLSELFAVGGLRHGRGKVSAMIPDDRRNRLIVIADERAYVQIRHVISACPDIDLDASEDTDGPVEVPEGVPDGERE